MAKPPETRTQLRRLYVYERLSLEAAAAQMEIGVATARRWKAAAEHDGDDWDRARAAARMATDGMQNVAQMILDDYLTLHQAVIEQVKSADNIQPLAKAEVLSRLADAFTKTMSAVSKASPQLSRLSVATDVLNRLAAYARETDPAAAAVLLTVLEPFAAELAVDYA